MKCKFCGTRKKCLAQRNIPLTRQDIEKLMSSTPFSVWQTPAQIAHDWDYTIKHIIRLVNQHEDKIAAIQEDGRYYILRCSFDLFLENR